MRLSSSAATNSISCLVVVQNSTISSADNLSLICSFSKTLRRKSSLFRPPISLRRINSLYGKRDMILISAFGPTFSKNLSVLADLPCVNTSVTLLERQWASKLISQARASFSSFRFNDVSSRDAIVKSTNSKEQQSLLYIK